MINEAELGILECNKLRKAKGRSFTLLVMKRIKRKMNKNWHHEQTSSHFRQDSLHHDSSIFKQKMS